MMLEVSNGMMSVIVATRREFIAVLDDFVFCHACESEESAFTEMYYIPVLNCIFCKNCLDLYLKTAVMYKVDRKIEKKNFERMMNRFRDLGVWENSWF